MIMSGKMLLEWLGREHKEPKASNAAYLIDDAMQRIIAELKSVTRDIGGNASTQEMGDKIAEAVTKA
jgi:3-isopropylmalate dehydrogenase